MPTHKSTQTHTFIQYCVLLSCGILVSFGIIMAFASPEYTLFRDTFSLYKAFNYVYLL